MKITNFKRYRGKNVLITGGLGFIGSNLACELVRLGAKVRIIDALLDGYGGNLFNIEPVAKRVEVIISDLRDKAVVEEAVKNREIIFNLAGTLSHVDSMKDPLTDLDINCRAQLVFLEAVRKVSPRATIIYAGTRNQYGRARYLPVDEDHPQESTDINGIHCTAAESYHFLYSKIYSLKSVSLRMTNTFGPRHQMKHPRQGVLNWFIRQLIEGEEVLLYGEGHQVRDINFIDDVSLAFLAAGISEKGLDEAYNLGGEALSLEQFVRLCIKVFGKGRYRKVAFPKDRKAIEIGDYKADWSKMKKTFGWEPKIRVEKGVRETFEYYQKNKGKYW